jgi:hypothetical protein
MADSLRRTATGVVVAGGTFLFKWLVSQGKPATQISSADPVEGAPSARVVLSGGAFVIKWGAGAEPRTVEQRTVATVMPPIQRAIATSSLRTVGKALVSDSAARERTPLPADLPVATDGFEETPTRPASLADPMANSSVRTGEILMSDSTALYDRTPLAVVPAVATDGTEETPTRISSLADPMTKTPSLDPMRENAPESDPLTGEVHMNDSTAPGERTPLAPVLPVATDGIYETPPEVVAIRDARQRAAETRSAAERLLREAQAAEAQLVVQEEEALAATAAARRERLAENARAAIKLEREARDTLSALQVQIQHVASVKSQTEVAVVALRASLAEHEDQLRAVEARECQLLADVTVAERHAHECTRARELVEAALNGAIPEAPVSNDNMPDPGATTHEVPSPESLKAKYAAERRAADAARAKDRSRLSA